MNGDSEKWDSNTLLIQSVERDIKYSNHTNTIHILNIITLFHYSIRINTKEMWISDKMTLQFSKLIFTCSISIYTHYKQQLATSEMFPYSHIFCTDPFHSTIQERVESPKKLNSTQFYQYHNNHIEKYVSIIRFTETDSTIRTETTKYYWFHMIDSRMYTNIDSYR